MEATPMKKVNEKRMDVAEMKMLRWLFRRDRISNMWIRGTVKVAEVSKKVQEARLIWNGHILRRDEEDVERRMMNIEVQGHRGERKAEDQMERLYSGRCTRKTTGCWDGA